MHTNTAMECPFKINLAMFSLKLLTVPKIIFCALPKERKPSCVSSSLPQLQQWITITCKARHVGWCLSQKDKAPVGWDLNKKGKNVESIDLIKHESFQEGKHVSPTTTHPFSNISIPKTLHILEKLLAVICRKYRVTHIRKTVSHAMRINVKKKTPKFCQISRFSDISTLLKKSLNILMQR